MSVRDPDFGLRIPRQAQPKGQIEEIDISRQFFGHDVTNNENWENATLCYESQVEVIEDD